MTDPKDDKTYELDRFDRQLLDALQRDALATAEALSQQVALSPSSIARRVRRLRQEGWIEADAAIAGRKIAERRLFAVVSVMLDAHAPHQGLLDLLGVLNETPEVSLCAEISGTFDLFILVCARDMGDYNRIVDEVLAGHPVVQRYESQFVKKWRKRRLDIPMTEG